MNFTNAYWAVYEAVCAGRPHTGVAYIGGRWISLVGLPGQPIVED